VVSAGATWSYRRLVVVAASIRSRRSGSMSPAAGRVYGSRIRRKCDGIIDTVFGTYGPKTSRRAK
jgi:hypothetical protein